MTTSQINPLAEPEGFFEIDGVANHNGWLGFKVTKVEHGLVEAEMPIRIDQLNPMGGLHGGVSASFADSLCGYGAMTSRPDGCIGFATVNLQSSYLGVAGEGEILKGVATLLRGGRQLQVWDVVVTCDGRQVTDARVTQLMRYPK